MLMADRPVWNAWADIVLRVPGIDADDGQPHLIELGP
jgi:hypothetical protein